MTGTYSCEVSTEGTFETVKKTAKMNVIGKQSSKNWSKKPVEKKFVKTFVKKFIKKYIKKFIKNSAEGNFDKVKKMAKMNVIGKQVTTWLFIGFVWQTVVEFAAIH